MSESWTDHYFDGLDVKTLASALVAHVHEPAEFTSSALVPHLIKASTYGSDRHHLSYWSSPNVDLQALTLRHRSTALSMHSYSKGIDYQVEQLWHCGSLLYELFWFSEEATITFTVHGREECVRYDADVSTLERLAHCIHQTRENHAESLSGGWVVPLALRPLETVKWYDDVLGRRMISSIWGELLPKPEGHDLDLEQFRVDRSFRGAWGHDVLDEVERAREEEARLQEVWAEYTEEF